MSDDIVTILRDFAAAEDSEVENCVFTDAADAIDELRVELDRNLATTVRWINDAVRLHAVVDRAKEMLRDWSPEYVAELDAMLAAQPPVRGVCPQCATPTTCKTLGCLPPPAPAPISHADAALWFEVYQWIEQQASGDDGLDAARDLLNRIYERLSVEPAPYPPPPAPATEPMPLEPVTKYTRLDGQGGEL